MQFHPMVSQHVARAVPAAFVAVLVQPFGDTRDDNIDCTLQVGQRTDECTFVRCALHTRQHSERPDVDALVLPDTFVNPGGWSGQNTCCIAVSNCLGWSEQASYEWKHLPGDQERLAGKKSSVCGNALSGKAVPPEPGIGVRSGMPRGVLCDGNERGMSGNEAR